MDQTQGFRNTRQTHYTKAKGVTSPAPLFEKFTTKPAFENKRKS